MNAFRCRTGGVLDLHGLPHVKFECIFIGVDAESGISGREPDMMPARWRASFSRDVKTIILDGILIVLRPKEGGVFVPRSA